MVLLSAGLDCVQSTDSEYSFFDSEVHQINNFR